MRIGIAFDLKPVDPAPDASDRRVPDDLYEEFDSPATIQAIAKALQEAGHIVVELGNGRELLAALLAEPPDFVFNFAEGSGVSRNRESRVPAVCEMLGVPYTGSDALTMALALDKDMARRIVAEAGVTVPIGIVMQPPNAHYEGDFAEFAGLLEESGLMLPVIAKPTCEGSSKGIRNRCLIETVETFGPTVASLWNDYHQPVLIEEFIAGDEVTVGILGNDPPQIIGVMRVVPRQPTDRFVYSLEVKRDYLRQVDYECPPKLPAGVLRTVEEAALAAYDALGCRDVARLDFRIRDGIPYFLEANPLPGLNPVSSDLVIMAKLMNTSHGDLVREIFDAAVRRASEQA